MGNVPVKVVKFDALFGSAHPRPGIDALFMGLVETSMLNP